MTVTDTSGSDRNAKPANMHTDAQPGATPLNMHTDVVVSRSGSIVTITGRNAQGGSLTVTLPKQVADVVKGKVADHVTATHRAQAATPATAPVYQFDTTAQVTGDSSSGIVITGSATSLGATSRVELTIAPSAMDDLGAQRDDL